MPIRSAGSRAYLLRSHPECALALDVLKAHGGRMPVCLWFAQDPSLATCTRGERLSIVRLLKGAGFIREAGLEKCTNGTSRTGRTGTSWRTIWAVV